MPRQDDRQSRPTQYADDQPISIHTDFSQIDMLARMSATAIVEEARRILAARKIRTDDGKRSSQQQLSPGEE